MDTLESGYTKTDIIKCYHSFSSPAQSQSLKHCKHIPLFNTATETPHNLHCNYFFILPYLYPYFTTSFTFHMPFFLMYIIVFTFHRILLPQKGQYLKSYSSLISLIVNSSSSENIFMRSQHQKLVSCNFTILTLIFGQIIYLSDLPYI